MNFLPVTAWRRLVVAGLFATLLLVGCATQRLVYNQADWLLLRQMDSYLDLTGPQKSRAEQGLRVAHERHRRLALPGFAAAFADLSAHVQHGLTETDVQGFVDRARDLMAESLDPILPTVSEALAGASPEQRQYLQDQLEERNEDYAERNDLDRPRAERLQRRAERTISSIEDWTGPLSEEQRDLVHEVRDAMPDSAADWLVHTRLRQQKLMTMMENGVPAQTIQDFLREWWLFRDELPPALERVRAQQISAIVSLLTRLAATLDSVQRIHLVDRLDDLARDAHELAREA